jgi:hypothetical protein
MNFTLLLWSKIYSWRNNWFSKMWASLNPRRVQIHDRTSGRSPDLSLYVEYKRRVFSSIAFPRIRAVARRLERKRINRLSQWRDRAGISPASLFSCYLRNGSRHLKPKLVC